MLIGVCLLSVAGSVVVDGGGAVGDSVEIWVRIRLRGRQLQLQRFSRASHQRPNITFGFLLSARLSPLFRRLNHRLEFEKVVVASFS